MNPKTETMGVILAALATAFFACAPARAGECNGNGIPDSTEPDCNANTLPDDCDIAGKIYWGDAGTDRITRAYFNGSRFENVITTGVATPRGVAVDVAAGVLYWSDSFNDHIAWANLDGSGAQPLITGLNTPQAIALDPGAGKMYWTDSGTDKIQRANLDGTNVEDLVTTGLMTPQTVALDLVAGKMYWTDFEANHIRSANLDGTNIGDPVPTATNPYGIALDAAGGKMYWTEWGNPRVRRANLDGSSPESIVTTLDVNLDDPSGIALDLAAGKVYWTDAVADVIRRCNLDGSNIEDLVIAGQLIDARPLTIALPIADADTNGIPDECEGAPNLLGAVTSKPNVAGPGGFCDLPIDMTPGDPITTEPRSGGITELVFTYDGPVAGGTVSVESDCTCPTPPSYVPIDPLVDCLPDGDLLVCTFTPELPNACTYRFTVPSGAATVSVELRGMIGDVNHNGAVNGNDRSTVIGAWTSPSGFSCATDVNSSGSTDGNDRSIVIGAWTGTGTNCAP